MIENNGRKEVTPIDDSFLQYFYIWQLGKMATV